MPIARLERTIFRLSGAGVTEWLEGLITNTLQSEICFAALLTPQGKIIADFFVTKDAETLLLDTAEKFGGLLHKRLKMYKLRAPITIDDISHTHSVYALWNSTGENSTEKKNSTGILDHEDPRLPALGRRLITENDREAADRDPGDYNAHRLSLGIPDSHWDFETQTTFPADANMDLINGIDFKKGCFIGQEVVSRMKRMTTVKKRFRGLVFETPQKTGTHIAKIGTDIKAGDRTIGTVLSVHEIPDQNAYGMGMIRLDRLLAATDNPTVDGAPIQIMGEPNGTL